MTKPAFDAVRDMRNGRLLAEFDDALAELISACQRTGKAGSLSLTFKVKPDLGSGTVDIEDNLTTKAPCFARTTRFHVTPDMNLSLRDPNQTDFIEGKQLSGVESLPPREAPEQPEAKTI